MFDLISDFLSTFIAQIKMWKLGFSSFQDAVLNNFEVPQSISWEGKHLFMLAFFWIWNALRDLVPFVQFKTPEKHSWRGFE